ncbi:MAG: aminoacyl-histidine dipeptidase [candidate division KSB1 bacterium]|nr:aminoacyl-histidine dipeptidase [candidate division KSB1 bacterium]
MSELTALQPQRLWKFFDDLRQIPRPSGQEEKVADYLVKFAKDHNLDYKKDDVGNVLITHPGSKGYESSPTVVLQAHTDMVCEKNSDVDFDFDKDPIKVKIEDNWVTADGTTLGADNGIGVAAALAILEDDSLTHGPLEALFTVDEERGLIGAVSVPTDWLKGRKLINLDSEDIGLFSIGCAGGADSHVTLPVKRRAPKGSQALKVHVSGLRGGHSGIDIHEGRGNAVKILNRLLYQLNKDIDLELASLNGGDKHNAIPREAVAHIVVADQDADSATEKLNAAIEEIKTEFHPVEEHINLTVEPVNTGLQVLDPESQDVLMALIFAYPHGVLAMSRTIDGLVETSNNVASVKTSDQEVKLHLSARSSNDAALQATLDKFVAITKLANAEIEQPEGYPGWMPDVDSEILKIAMDTYKQVTGENAQYEAIHAGLECGLIGEKFDGMDMISVGPTLKHPHSPDERVDIETVDVFYKHVLRMLEVLASQ